METRILWKLSGGGFTVYVISSLKDKAKWKAVEMIWGIPMPEGMLNITDEHKKFYDCLTATSFVFEEIE